MIRFFVLALCFVVQLAKAQNPKQVIIASPPLWIGKVTYVIPPTDTTTISGGYYTLLIDEQYYLRGQEAYFHYAHKVYSENGLENCSTISVDFDPDYQQLTFHSLEIVRGGTRIQQVHSNKVEILKREKNLERAMYDGKLTAVYNVEDLQVGDVVEYAYSIKGSSPLFAGKFARFLYFNYSVPVSSINYRIIDYDDRLEIRSFGDVPKHEVTKKNGQWSYVWKKQTIPARLSDDQAPGWFDPYNHVQVSEFGEWADLAAWANGFFWPGKKIPLLKKIPAIQPGDTTQSIQSTIRFVQDEIRYLSISRGINNFRPHDPSLVLKQRYGDCKDKSVLLASLLQELGVSSKPVLVNTDYGKALPEYLASPGLFNHCIVQFVFRDSTYWVDPTLSLQRGPLHELSVPQYHFGLVISNENNSLTAIPEAAYGKINAREMYAMDSVLGGATLVVETEYTRDQANSVRSSIKSSSREEIQKQYLNFYANDYADISLTKPITWTDNEISNVFRTREEYSIPKFWTYDSSAQKHRADVYARNLATFLTKPTSKIRTAPLALSYPLVIRQQIQIKVPEAWSVTPSSKRIDTDGFYYESTVGQKELLIELAFEFKSKAYYLDPAKVPNHIVKLDEALDDLTFNLWYGNTTASEAKFNYPYLLILGGVLALSAIGFKRLYNMDPLPRPSMTQYDSIGGWLILPAIGLALSPLIICYQLYNVDYFRYDNWAMLADPSFAGYNPMMGLFVLVELLLNGILILLSVLACILFYTRRTSAPYFASAYYVSHFALLTADSVVGTYFGSEFDGATMKEILRSFIGIAIWVPYFTYSNRSKGTFTRRRTREEEISPLTNSSYP